MRAHGHVFKYGDNVDTDVIIPARYLNSFDAQELASHAMLENGRSKLHYRGNVRKNLLQKCNQYRSSDY